MPCASRTTTFGHDRAMNILLVLIPLSLVLVGFAFMAFRWAVRNRQFEDLDSAALDVLREDRPLLHDPKHDAD